MLEFVSSTLKRYFVCSLNILYTLNTKKHNIRISSVRIHLNQRKMFSFSFSCSNDVQGYHGRWKTRPHPQTASRGVFWDRRQWRSGHRNSKMSVAGFTSLSRCGVLAFRSPAGLVVCWRHDINCFKMFISALSTGTGLTAFRFDSGGLRLYFEVHASLVATCWLLSTLVQLSLQ